MRVSQCVRPWAVLTPLSLCLSSISPVTRLAALCCLLAAVTTRPVSCDGGHGKGDGGESARDGAGDAQSDTLSPQLSVTSQATPTPLWAVVWGPTHPIEDETPHFLPSQETGDFQHPTTESWQLRPNPPTTKTQQGERKKEGEDEEGEDKGDREEGRLICLLRGIWEMKSLHTVIDFSICDEAG